MKDTCWCGGKLYKSVHKLYLECSLCGTLVYEENLDAENLKRFYTLDNYWNDHVVNVSKGPSIEERSAVDFEGRIQTWFSILEKHNANVESLLEIGCAHGGFLHYAASKGVKKVVGIEVDENTCQFAKLKFNLTDIISGLFPDVDLPIKKFDAIVGFDVFEHFADPVKATIRTSELLTDGGICIFQTPSFRHENEEWLQFRPGEHLYLFNPRAIAKLFSEHNLNVTEILLGINPDDMFIIAKKEGVHTEHVTQPNSKIKITSQYGEGHEVVKIGEQSLFAQTISQVFQWKRPQKIIETGTFLGKGTTTIIASTLKSLGMMDAEFHSIEINPKFHSYAFENLMDNRLISFVNLHNGLSVPRSLLPNLEEIKRTTVDEVGFSEIFVDHQEEERSDLYYKETDFPGIKDDLLGELLQKFNYKPDFVLLDSGGHMGFVEFNYLIENLESECIIALDDVYHVKHRKSLQLIESDPRFDIIALSKEKFGFCIAKFKPAKQKTVKHAARRRVEAKKKLNALPQNLVAIGLVEHIGDIIACEPVARYVRNLYPDSYIVWVTKPSYRDLIDSNPYINETYAVSCLTEWIFLKNSGLFDEVFDLHIQKRVCPTCDLPLEKNVGRIDITLENYYNHGNLLSAFCQNAGLPILTDAPQLYIRDYEKQRVDNLKLPENYVVFHCLSNEYTRDWNDDNWIALARRIKAKWNLKIVEVGHRSVLSKDNTLNAVNLCGALTILETAEVVKKAKIFVGIDSAIAHAANAVNTYGIILLGEYRAFKKYLPYSGNYANGVNSEIIYAAHGPASEIPVNRVLFAVEKALEKISVDGIKKDDKTQTAALFEYDHTKDLIKNFLAQNPFRLISLYLPQFHPFPQNDNWWGKGFTEWTNVTKAKPLFPGHYQPHLPSDLGFYDLRLEESRIAQAELATQYGLEGFCYYHYWFNGRRLLERPFNEVLQSGKPEFPFCLAWANENWTKRWDGRESEMLQEQVYGGDEDAIQHFKWLYKAFADKRYIRIDNKPLFMIYRPSAIPELERLISIWRDLAERSGLEGIYLVAMKTGFEKYSKNYWLEKGFDAEVVFQPGSGEINKLNKWQSIGSLGGEDYINNQAIVIDYAKAWPIMAAELSKEDQGYACVVPSWDNSARRAKIGAWILHNSTPQEYQKWLMQEMSRVLEREDDKRVVFINAWNEWAEGNHLEPDMKFGHGYLRATKNAVVDSLEKLAKVKLFDGDLESAEIYCKLALFNYAELEAESLHSFKELSRSDQSGYLDSRKSYERQLSEIHLLLGVINRLKGNDEKAFFHFGHATAFNKENVTAAICNADLCSKYNLGEKASLTYQNLFLQDDQTKILLNTGRILDLIGNEHAALFIKSAFDYSIQPDNVEEISYYDLKLLGALNQIQFGISTGIALEVMKGISFYRQANVYLNEGNLEDAKQCFAEAISYLPKHATSLAGLAIVFKQLGDDKAAIENMIKAISIEPNNTQLIKMLADLYSDMGSYKNAIDIYRQLLIAEPNNCPLLLSIANLQLTLGDFSSAEKLVNRVLEIEPQNEFAHAIKNLLSEQNISQAQPVFK